MRKILRLSSFLLVFASASITITSWSQSPATQTPHTGAKPSAIPDFGSVYVNSTSDYKQFTLFGANLSSDVTVGPSSSYSFSVAPGGPYSPTVTVTPLNGRINQIVYVKFSPAVVKQYHSSIPVSGGGAISFKVSASGTGIMTNTPSQVLTQLAVQLLSRDEGNLEAVDGLMAVFGEGYSAAIGDEDSYKFTNDGENIAINRSGTILSIEGRPFVTSADTLPLQIWKLKQKEYYLKIAGIGFSPLLSASLKDHYLNTETPIDLLSTTLIPFTNNSATFTPNRFSVILKTGGLLPVILTNIKAYAKDKGVQVEWDAQSELNIEKYELERSIDGQHFDKVSSVQAKGNNSITQSYSWLDVTANSGNNYYRIKVVEKSGAVKYSQVVRVSVRKVNSNVTIYPNPVRGNVIGFCVHNVDKGIYAISLFNNAGQKVYAGLIEHNGGSANYSLSIGRQISRGIYSLLLMQGQIVFNKTVIVE